MARGMREAGNIPRGRRVAVSVVAAALSALGGALLTYGPIEGQWFYVLLAGALGLVVVATVVETLWSGRVEGPFVGALPLSVVYWIGLDLSADAQAGLAGLFISFYAIVVATVTWWLALTGIDRRKREYPEI